MKKQSIIFALMSLVALGVVFASCANSDNPYIPTTPDGKYVMVKDSVVYSNGDIIIKNWEYDAEGKVVKEILSSCYADGTTDQSVNNYTYTPDLITSEVSYTSGDTKIFYLRLNNKGLVEQLEDVSENLVYNYKYDDGDRIIWHSENGSDESITWKYGDVEKYDYGYGVTYYSWTNYKNNFPYLTVHVDYYDDILAQMGYFGKPTRHLVSEFHYDIEDDDYSAHGRHDFSYVVLGGLVMEFTQAYDIVVVDNGVKTNDDSSIHHYITWEKQ